jgi:DNA-binding NtrC family response regulator
VIDRALVLCAGDVIEPEHILLRAGAAQSAPPASVRGGGPPPSMRAPSEDEKARIQRALTTAGGNQTEAAKILGISRRTLLHRLDEYGLPRPRKRES